MYYPDFETFRSLAAKGNLIPVYREILADMDTPVSAFKKIDDGRFSFLLESIEGGEKWARYSFLGSSPEVIIRSKGNVVETLLADGTCLREETADPLGFVRNYLGRFSPVEVDGLPRFFGGAVGYIGYDMVRYFERVCLDKPTELDAYDSYLLITDTLLIFDTVRQKIKVVSNAHLEEGTSPEAAYEEAKAKIDAIIRKMKTPIQPSLSAAASQRVAFLSNVSREVFEESVVKAKEYVKAGDVIQVVLSQRFSADLTVDPLDIYRILLTFIKEKLDDRIQEVRLSGRLTDSACCLVADEYGMNANMERILKSMNQEVPESKRILELNPDHAITKIMQKLFDKDKGNRKLDDYCELLFDQALLTEGSPIKDPLRFTKLISELMVAAGENIVAE